MKKILTLAVFALAASLSAQVSNPGAPIVGSLDLTSQGANVASTTVFTPTATGFYMVSAYLVVTQAATSSSTLPQINLQWTDPDTNAASPVLQASTTYAGNAVGGSNAAGADTRVIYAKGGSAVTLTTTNFASSGVTPMLFNLHVRVTQIQ